MKMRAEFRSLKKHLLKANPGGFAVWGRLNVSETRRLILGEVFENQIGLRVIERMNGDEGLTSAFQAAKAGGRV